MRRVLIIYSGGTLGMVASKASGGLSAAPSVAGILEKVPELQSIARIETVSPYAIDSADLSLDHIRVLAETILSSRAKYDGFVVIHGTDSMAYSASALSFMLLGFPKPIVFTGSQRPLQRIRTDARRNLINAVEIATSDIAETAIFFGDRLYRGNRTTKISNWKYDAFDSPNFPSLGQVGLDIELSDDCRRPGEAFDPSLALDPSVFVLKVYPGMPVDAYFPLALTKGKAFILEAYGGGTIPLKVSSLLKFIETAMGAGNLVAVNTQCHHGGVLLDMYESARILKENGTLSCKDMTIEASIMKMMYLLGRYGLNSTQTASLFTKNLAGELSEERPNLHQKWSE
ncbi:MAG: asparaginase [Desulfohalobiaceae bacterium]|nr:asparaginase [Desulfohalobiaceae bacterium]